PDHQQIGVGLPAWLNGLAEAASELRRHLLDRLRAGELERGEQLLVAMADVYDLLVTIDYPNSLPSALRRSWDALRAVLYRSRAARPNVGPNALRTARADGSQVREPGGPGREQAVMTETSGGVLSASPPGAQP